MMPGAGWSPKLVPYLPGRSGRLPRVESFSASGAVYRETEVERTDFETIIADFLTGHFAPVDQHHRGHAGNRFGHRVNREDGVRRHRRTLVDISCARVRAITSVPP